MNRALGRWGVCLPALMLASLTAGATPEFTLQLIQGQSGKVPGDEIRRICPNEFDVDVYSPGLVVRTLKAEEMADATATIRKLFGQGESRVVFEHVLVCDRCPEGASSGASVSTTLDGREYALGVLFPEKGQDPDVYRVRVQEMRVKPAGGKKDGPVGGVIPPTLLSVPVRCPRGHVGVVGFSDFKGEPLFLVLKPREAKGEK